MIVKYKIIKVDTERHSIVVRYTTEKLTEEVLAYHHDLEGNILNCKSDISIDLPIPTPTGEDLENLILRCANRSWLEKEEAILNPAIDTSMSSLLGLVNKESEGLIPEPKPFVPVEFIIPETPL